MSIRSCKLLATLEKARPLQQGRDGTAGAPRKLQAQDFFYARDRAHYVEVVFPRHWARVKLRRPHSRLHPSCLTIESHGRRCEVGSFLTEQERRGLAQRLTRLIGRINESPSLA